MQLSTFISIASKNIKGIIFATSEQAQAVSDYLHDAIVTDNLLYFGDANAVGAAINLAGIADQSYCFIGQSCKLPMIEPYVDMDKPCIYVACLASYNNGILHGIWIDARQDIDNIQDDINYMLSYSHQEVAEEYAIHDYAGFCGLHLSEYESLEKVSELAQILEEHGDAYVAYANNVGLAYATIEGFEESYRGEWESELDFATERFDETMEVPEHLVRYIDYEQYAYELFMDGFSSHSINGGGVYVFADY